MAELRFPFEGLPTGWFVLFTVALVVIVSMLGWTGLLFWRARRLRLDPPQIPDAGTSPFSWVFLVPALNEEITIRDSVQRLLAIDLERRRILVIDDGSDDRTAEILAAIEHPDLHVLHRRAPQARQGKAAALNHGYRTIDRLVDGTPRDQVILVVVDADGRLHPHAPAYAAAHLAESKVGGVQSLVRIYNRARPLTWMQDLEFSIYGALFQAGRNGWGSAGMGGNGQFNRLQALDQVADHEGPWRDRLTEDQDLGLRLIAAGWLGRQDLRATVEQQGLPRLKPLFRQRTRWSQGNLQSISLAGAVMRAPVPLVARAELLAYLLMPLWQGIVGVALLAAIGLAITNTTGFYGGGAWWTVLFFYLLGFGGTMLGCIASRAADGLRGWVSGFLIAHIYAFYSWMLWPVLARSTLRQLSERRDWAKTRREPLARDA